MESFPNLELEEAPKERLNSWEQLRESRFSPQTDRGIEDYQVAFGIDVDTLRGKKILDLGSGKGAFIKEAWARGIEVVGVNPGVYHKEILPNHPKEKTAAALAQSLPFKDQSFDVIFSVYGVPYYLEELKSEYVAMFREIARTLKNDGTAYLWPFREVKLKRKEFADAVKEVERDLNIEVTHTDMDNYKLVITKVSQAKE